MLTVALTGGIASGKSVITDLFEQLGAEVIDTDLLSRELVAPGSPLLKQISDHFGQAILDHNAALDRDKLRQCIFNHNAERLALEDILHPAIRELVYARISASTASYIIVAIPLLIETRYPYQLDRILVVDTPLEQQLARLIERDQISASDAKKIVDTQATRASRLAAADDVISNDSTINVLQQQVVELHQRYLQLSQSHSQL